MVMYVVVLSLIYEQTGQAIPMQEIALTLDRETYLTASDCVGRVFLTVRQGRHVIGVDTLTEGYEPWQITADVQGNVEIRVKIPKTGPGQVPLFSARPSYSVQKW